jgi:hypothetical protein
MRAHHAFTQVATIRVMVTMATAAGIAVRFLILMGAATVGTRRRLRLHFCLTERAQNAMSTTNLKTNRHLKPSP